ncbi:GPI inositol-deacylase [Frankia sp. CiP3]|uniref:GPI inositol-deacylase n=1 Tax=Frankia sp. CiP3 TaxID=2880971 RepID=UPI001EF6FDE1|nr:GPI inositol-deacylase [Frankia sp. CiP3]
MTDDTLRVTGGAGGVTARYDDMLTCAAGLTALSRSLMDRLGYVTAAAGAPDVLEGAVLAPVTAARIAEHAVAATAGPHGLAQAATHLTVSALTLHGAVLAYQALDEALAAEQCLTEAAGAVPELLDGGDMPLDWLRLDGDLFGGPAGWSDLRAWWKDTSHDLMDNVYRNPWIIDGLIHDAPALVTLAGTGLFLLSPALGGVFVYGATSDGGSFPPLTFEDATRDTLGLGGLFGLFTNGTGSAESLTGTTFLPLGDDDVIPTNVTSLIAGVGQVARYNHQGPDDSEPRGGEIRILKIHGKDGIDRYIVEIPGTQEWSPEAGKNPMDLTNNLRLMGGTDSAQNHAIIDAMRKAGIPSDAPVLLAGHSQGGITAASLASDPTFRREFNVTNIVTAGSPIGRFDIPDDVHVLSLEHTRDTVPRLDGTPNPDRPGWVTVQRDADGVQDGSKTVHDIGASHMNGAYQDTARLVDGSSDPSITGARNDLAPFLTDDPTDVSVQDYQLTRQK